MKWTLSEARELLMNVHADHINRVVIQSLREVTAAAEASAFDRAAAALQEALDYADHLYEQGWGTKHKPGESEVFDRLTKLAKEMKYEGR